MCATTIAQANTYFCSGFAEGRGGSRLDAWISPETVDHVRADWTPPHSGTGPMSLRLTYNVRGGRLTGLRRAWVEGEIAADAFDTQGTGYVAVMPDAESVWRVALRSESVVRVDPHGAIPSGNDTTTSFATVVVASDHPQYPGEALTHPERLFVLEKTGSVRITAFGRADKPFSDSLFDLSNRQDRDQLFRIAYARAAKALSSGCTPADSMCECGG